MTLRPCLDCGIPTDGARCPAHARVKEQARKAPRLAADNDPTYRAYRAWVRRVRPPCHLCGLSGADSVDHIVALAAGGPNVLSNFQPAHRACNARKGQG